MHDSINAGQQLSLHQIYTFGRSPRPNTSLWHYVIYYYKKGYNA